MSEKKEKVRGQEFNLEEIVVNAKKDSSPISKIMKDRTQEAHAEYEATKLQRLVEEERQQLRKLKSQGETVEVGQAQNYVQMLFGGRKPEEVKEILASIGPEQIQKLAMITAAMNNNQLGTLMQFMGRKDTSINDQIQLIKTVVDLSKPQQPQGGITLQGIAALMKEMRESQKPVETKPKKDSMELAMEYIKPFYEAMTAKDKQFYQSQIDNVRGQIVDPIAYLEKIKEVAPSLGFVQASKSGQPNIELEKMKLDQERWKTETDWRIQKELADMKLKQQSDKDKWKMIEKIAVPAVKQLRPVLDAAVSAGKSKIKSMGPQEGGGVSAKQAATSILCPECAKNGVQTIIDVADMPDVAVCPVCKTEFPKKQT